MGYIRGEKMSVHKVNKTESQASAIEKMTFELGEKVQEIGQAVQTALLTLNPITNAIFTAFSEWNTKKSLHQLEVMILRLSERLATVEDLQEDFLQSDEFKELLFKTCHKVVADLREEKARLFGDFLAGMALQEGVSSSDSFMMLEVLDKLELEHVSFLAKLESRTFDPAEKEAGWTGDEEDLKQLGVDKERFYLLSDYLANLGLVSRLEQFKVEAETGYLVMWRAYYLSMFGKELLKVLKLNAEKMAE